MLPWRSALGSVAAQTIGSSSPSRISKVVVQTEHVNRITGPSDCDRAEILTDTVRPHAWLRQTAAWVGNCGTRHQPGFRLRLRALGTGGSMAVYCGRVRTPFK